MSGTALVLGATGTTGSAVVDAFRRFPDLSVRTATRQPTPPTTHDHRRFDWADPATWRDALHGADRMYLVAPIGSAEPMAMVAPFLEQAAAAGVRRVVALSSSAVAFGDPGLGEVAAAVRETFAEWEVLRPSWFMQNFTGAHPVAESVRATGEFITATGAGRLAFIDGRDIGRVAAHVLAAPGAQCGEHLLTGPEALTYDEAAAIMAEVTGRTVRHRPVDPERFADFLVASGYDAEFAAVLAALDALVRDGAQAAVTDTVERLTGTPPRSFATYLRALPPA
ncbi:NmrA family NAD(P)-binding protein [Mycolicibacterium baixiangningiae]|uniref:NmrA family NAD(P)-binding protein n=1 Tax=Mycolicibacterium baixiangningiae TaxID=2761578 RepID=UPI001865F524|nr:NmrA family NAD(P)-binding protein [Mycolicibacterium baixiangningiae]